VPCVLNFDGVNENFFERLQKNLKSHLKQKKTQLYSMKKLQVSSYKGSLEQPLQAV
jgi:hypothetical protein